MDNVFNLKKTLLNFFSQTFSTKGVIGQPDSNTTIKKSTF